VFDHISIGVKDLDRAATFYDAALAALGYVRLAQNARSVSYGSAGFQGEPPFAILASGPDARPPDEGIHIAFAARTRESVDQFHAAALRAGGTDQGPPGIRANYHPGYYAAFVRDPDGHRLEAVLHESLAR
jgi:catechol 2,3-dioxygenase-like lactoylglutathione lyase family enzyme